MTTDTKIDELNTLAAIQDTDLFPVVDVTADETKNISYSSFLGLLRVDLSLVSANIGDLTSTITNNAAVALNTLKRSFPIAFENKINGIEDGATADQSAPEIKTAYESNPDTNALTNALLAKINAIESNATADQSNTEIESAYNAQVGIATQAEMEAGTSTVVKRMTPQRVAQAIAELGAAGGGAGFTASYLPSKTGASNDRFYGAVQKEEFLYSMQNGYIRRMVITAVGLVGNDDPAGGTTGFYNTGSTTARSLTSLDESDDYLYWQESSAIRRLDVTTKTEVTMTLAGGATMASTSYIVADNAGGYMYILATNSTSMQRCTVSGTVITLESTITLPDGHHTYYAGGSNPTISGDYLYYFGNAGSQAATTIVKNKLSTNTTEWEYGGYFMREQTNTWDYGTYRGLFAINSVVFIGFSRHDSEDYVGVFCHAIDSV